MNEIILKFTDFGFQYRVQSEPTLYHINLEVHRGEKILIAGPSGCGKSTMVHCMNGLIPFSYEGEMSGSLTLFGRETREMSLFDISKQVGTVLQDSDGQFVGMTVAEDIAFALENDCVGEPELHDKVLQAARLVHVENHLSHAPGDLSGGQKQRVAMAGVLVNHVDLLLFDEPLANLDPATGKEAVELIDELQKETGAAVIIIEHRIEDVLHRDVDRIVLMGNGRILFDGSPDELLSGPLLRENGIREPLYITALKYAGVPVMAEMAPHSIRSLRLTEEMKQRVRDWFLGSRIPKENTERPLLLQAEDLCFTYDNGFRALKGVSLGIRKGELCAIVGTNGAGKSTFAKVVCGFEPLDSGRLLFQGNDFTGLSIKERADRVGFCLQNPNQMISKVMIWDEVGFGLQLRKLPKEEINRKTGDTLRICGLWPMRNWPISAVSFGQKKRVTVAAILSMDPQMIILDEPTAGQDYRHYTDIMEFLKELHEQGVTIVMITHDMHLMLEYAERAMVFSDGQVIADDTPANILTNPEIIEKASLKETSLYHLALLCDIPEPRDFVQHFIDYERLHVRGKEAVSE